LSKGQNVFERMFKKSDGNAAIERYLRPLQNFFVEKILGGRKI